MARQVAQPLFLSCRVPSQERGRLSARHRGVLLPAAGHALRGSSDLWTTAVSQLLAGSPYWPPGGAPAPPECVLARHARRRRIRSRPHDASWERPLADRTL